MRSALLFQEIAPCENSLGKACESQVTHHVYRKTRELWPLSTFYESPTSNSAILVFYFLSEGSLKHKPGEAQKSMPSQMAFFYIAGDECVTRRTNLYTLANNIL
jgi:hypothetical protein